MFRTVARIMFGGITMKASRIIVPISSAVVIAIIGVIDVALGTAYTSRTGVTQYFYSLYDGLLQRIVGSLPYTSAILAGVVWLVLACGAFFLLFFIMRKSTGGSGANYQQPYNPTQFQNTYQNPGNTESYPQAPQNTAYNPNNPPYNPNNPTPYISAANSVKPRGGVAKMIGIALIIVSVFIDIVVFAISDFELFGPMLAIGGVLFVVGLLLTFINR